MRITNRWQRMFILLCAVNVLVIVAVAVLLLWPSPSPTPYEPGTFGRASAKLTVSATKDDLNELINRFLMRNAVSNKMKYRVVIDEEVQLSGTLKVFGRDIRMSMQFVPKVLDNGDLLLETTSMHIGALPLPVKKVLGFIRSQYTIPEWVTIEPDQERVYVALTELSTTGDLRPKAIAFDPVEDRFIFELFVRGDG